MVRKKLSRRYDVVPPSPFSKMKRTRKGERKVELEASIRIVRIRTPNDTKRYTFHIVDAGSYR